VVFDLKAISRDLSNGKGFLPGQVKLPDEFSKSWLYLTSYFVICAASINNSRFRPKRAQLKLEECIRLIAQGKQRLYLSTISIPLPEREAVFPLGFVTMLAKGLIEDVTPKQEDIYSTYLEY